MEVGEELFPYYQLSTLEPLPCSMGRRPGDGKVDPSMRNLVSTFVVSNGLEGRQDLACSSALSVLLELPPWATYANATDIKQ